MGPKGEALVFLDTETTGLNPRENGIHQLSGLVEVQGEVVDEFNYHLQVPHYKELADEALNMANLTPEDLKKPERVSLAEAYADLMAKVNKYGSKYVYGSGNPDERLTIVGYNVQFDIDFLKGWWTDLKRAGIVRGNEHLHSWFNYYFVDMYRFASFLRATGHLKTERLKLEVVANAIGIKFKAHDSLEDAKATRTFYHMCRKAFDPDLFAHMIKEAENATAS